MRTRTRTAEHPLPRLRLAWTAAAVAALSLAAALGAGAQQPAQRPAQGEVDALVARAAATYAAARTATASFEQTLTNPATGSQTVSRGIIQRRQPDRFNFQFTDPAGDRMVADGESVWIYTPSSAPRQVVKLPVAAVGAGSIDPGAQFFEKPRERFTIVDGGTTAIDGQTVRKLTLTPTRPIETFTKATVWLDPKDGTLRQFETLDGMGVTRRIRLTDVKVNVPVEAAAFRFTPPPGVRVVDQKALTGGR